MGFFNWLAGLFGKKKEQPINERAEAEIQQKSEKLKDFEKTVAGLKERYNSINDGINVAGHELKKWTKICNVAIESRDKSNVREAARHRLEAEQKLYILGKEQAEIAKTIIGLENQIKLANDKIEYSKAQNANLQARYESAKIREELVNEPIKSMTELEEETMKVEGQAEAKEEFSKFQQDFVKNRTISNAEVDVEVDRLLRQKK